jgi:RNA polymerase sigma factor (sigma-70 family)
MDNNREPLRQRRLTDASLEVTLDPAADQAILTALRTEDWRHAADLIVGTYGSTIFGLCRAMLAGSEAAEDLAQRALSAIFSSMSAFAEESSLSAWLQRQVSQCCLDHLRSMNLPTLAVELAAPSKAPSCRAEQVDDLQSALSQLNQADRALVALRYRHGLATSTISSVLRVSEPDLESRLTQAMGTLHRLSAALFEKHERLTLEQALAMLRWSPSESLLRRMLALCAAT